MDIKINISERPWGSYIKFLEEAGVWVKRVEVEPGARLSLQKHDHRSEKWNIVSGVALVTIDGKETTVEAGSIIDVPAKRCIGLPISESRNLFLLRSPVAIFFPRMILPAIRMIMIVKPQN